MPDRSSPNTISVYKEAYRLILRSKQGEAAPQNSEEQIIHNLSLDYFHSLHPLLCGLILKLVFKYLRILQIRQAVSDLAADGVASLGLKIG